MGAGAAPVAALGPAGGAARGKGDPRSDPRYRRVVEKLAADSRKLKQHPPAKRKAQAPAAAAKGPPDEKAAGARARQVDKISAAKTPKPQPTTFLAILQAEIAKAMPRTLGDTEKFMKGDSSKELKGSLKGNVDQQKAEATGELKQTADETPNEAGIAAKPVTAIPQEPHPAKPQVDAAGAMPAPKPAAEVSLEASKQEVAAQMKEERLTDERLKKANDPRFSAVLNARDAVNRQADAGPAKYRASEAATLSRAAGQAIGVAKKGISLLLGVKGSSQARVLSRQEQQKVKEEQELKAFTDSVKTTFDTAKTAVDSMLDQLENRVNDMFDKGVDRALANMKDYVERRLRRYKLERYLVRVGGAALWIKDQFMHLPDEVNAFYEEGRDKFTAEMNALAEQVANLVERELAATKKVVTEAQAKIAKAQKDLSPAVQARAAKVAAAFSERFAELQQGIEDRKQQLAEGLAQKYKDAFDKANEALKAVQQENMGLVTKARKAIGEVIKALREFKAKLMAVLRKAQNTIGLILDDPVRFLKNLLAAIKKGFGQFVARIWEHLKAGFFRWLFGSLVKMGIEVPKDLSLPSILKLVLGVLGITYARMREKAVKLIGPRAVAVIEKVAEYIGTLLKGGPAALWEMVKADLGSLKEMVIDAIQNWLITTIVKKAVAKIVSLFNPVGAIIQAILLIYDVVKFIVTKAAQILEFVEAVVDSIYNIATGAIAGAANYIEKALANMIPLLIGFLADLLGIGGITDKIKEFIKKVQAKVDKAIDKVIDKIVGVVKKLFGKLTGKGAKPDERTDAQKKADLDKAVRAANVALAAQPRRRKAAKKLAQIRKQYRLTRADIVVDGRKKGTTTFHAELEINPIAKSKKAGEMDYIDPAIQVTPSFFCKKSLNEKEFKDQLRLQESGINEMSVHTWLANRRRFEREGRSQEGTKKQRKIMEAAYLAARASVCDERKKVYMALPPKKTAAEATRMAEGFVNRLFAMTIAASGRRRFKISKLTDPVDGKQIENAMYKKAALHKVDQVAGGSGEDILPTPGGAREDFSLGAQWKGARIETLEKKVKQEVKGRKADEQKNIRMNVILMPPIVET